MGMTAGLIRFSEDRCLSILNGKESLDDHLFLDDDTPAENTVDLDKAWNGIMHRLERVAGNENSVLCRAGLGGQPFGDDLGFGPAMHLQRNEVQEISKLLDRIDEEKLREAFDAKDMAESDIYCFNADTAGDDLDYYTEHYRGLRAFYELAAQNEQAVIQYLI